MIYEVWQSGFMFSLDERANASIVGRIEANSFQEACDLLLKDNGLYNREHMTVWGCSLHDNEAAARKVFG